MATAVKEKPAYTMPKVTVSEIVTWYGDASGNLATAAPAQVISVSGSTVELRVELAEGRNRRIYDVLHVSDPRLEYNPNLRNNGAWDYSPQTKQIHDLMERVASLEDLISTKK